jgi:diguanylate cyclase (GGDEF)-like protein/putative nucleotidyltransferase with HDIG domain
MASATPVAPVRISSSHETDLRQASGLTTRLVLTYVEREGGPEAMRAVLERAGLAHRKADLLDENAWFADAIRVALFEAAAEVLEDPHVARRIGEASLDLNVAGPLKLALRALGSPRLIYSNAVKINAKFNLVHRLDLLALSDSRARIRNVPLDGIPWHPVDCDYNMGLMSAAPGLFGRPPARVRHPLCIGHGDDECVYDIEWSGPHDAARAVAGWSVSGLLVLAGTALVAPPLLPLAAVGATATAAVAGTQAARARQRRWRSLQSQAEQGSAAAERLTASLRDLVAGLDLDEVLGKITRNAQAAVGGTEFALLVEEEGALRCRSSSGLPAATVAALECWADGTARPLQAPLVIDDVGTVSELAGLPAAESLPLRSLCAAPLTFRDRSLGALIALAGASEGFLPRDVELLQSYAAQAAIALANARLYADQEARASRDPLTGLLNHREFHETVARELERCRRYGGRVAMILFDLDDFKLVNDTGGHAEGDRVLCEFAQALSRSCRASDLAFRIGGDEFALVLPETAQADAAAAAERVQAQTATLDRRLHVSAGVAAWPDTGPTKDALLARADEELYASKRTGEPAAAAAAAATGSGPVATQRARLALASRLSAQLAPLADPDEIARVAVDELQATFGWYLVVIHRLHPDGVLRPVAGAGKLLDRMQARLDEWEQTLDQGVNGRTARTGEPTLVSDTQLDPDFLAPAAPIVSSRSELALPIRVGGEVWGVLNLESLTPHAFGPDDVLFGDTIAAAVGAALQRSLLFGELESAFMRTLAVLSDALEAKDSYTAAHAREVADLAEAVGRALGMNPEARRTLRYAALLHDVGKIAVPTEILRKPGPLTDEEFDEVKRHTIIGAQMLERIPFFSGVHPLVRSAHERWDGRGYPDGRSGENIPLGARVICACDAYHAMTSDRPYRTAMSPEGALTELRAHSGTQFDPNVIDALVRVLGAAPAEAPVAS